MPLSYDLISEFVKVTQDKPKPLTESTAYGTVSRTEETQIYVKLDGSDVETPVNTSVVVDPGNRVLVRIKNHAATITDNLSVKSNMIAKYDEDGELQETIRVDDLVASSGTINELRTAIATVQDKLTTKYLTAYDIESNYLKTDNLSAKVSELGYLKAGELESEVAEFGYVKTTELDVKVGEFGYIKADNADITKLKADVAEIDTLLFNAATGKVVHADFSNAVISTLGDAWINSAMINSIDTNTVTIKSNDGKLDIADETIKISDANRVRVQIGKDGANDYSINIWDQNGNLIFDKTGVTDKGIADGLIRNNMISKDANISSSKVYLDDTDQTLDVAWLSLINNIDEQGKTIRSQSTSIAAFQGEINTKVTQQDTSINELNTKYTEITQTLTGISATVAEYATTIDSNAIEDTVIGLENKVSELELDLDGFRTSVSSTYATKEEVEHAQTTADEAVSKTANHETLIAQLSDSISTLVTDGNGTSLMTQTDDGWTFSTAEIQSLVNGISDSLNSLTHEVGNTNSVIDILQQTVNDLGEIAEYVRITTYEDEPCVEWGEGDSEFKLRITNTRMIFTEGSAVLGYFSNQSFHSKKVVIEEELQQGDFVWKKRANGNLGLTWRGGNN